MRESDVARSILTWKSDWLNFDNAVFDTNVVVLVDQLSGVSANIDPKVQTKTEFSGAITDAGAPGTFSFKGTGLTYSGGTIVGGLITEYSFDDVFLHLSYSGNGYKFTDAVAVRDKSGLPVDVSAVLKFYGKLFAGDDTISTGSNNGSEDHLHGYAGNDTLLASDGRDQIWGDAGNDVLNGGAGADDLDGGTGNDTASYTGASKGVTASLENTSLNTNDAKRDVYVAIENLFGSSHVDRLFGDDFANKLSGGGGNDAISGNAGNDRIYGGAGADALYGGADNISLSAGNDTFVYKALSDSTVGLKGRDTIFDMNKGDRIDLSVLDANTKVKGNQAFTYIGAVEFHGRSGELDYEETKHGTFIYGDVNGDAKADFAIKIDEVIALGHSFFVL
jgi:Ca2+-binding RTX toxin-like protein